MRQRVAELVQRHGAALAEAFYVEMLAHPQAHVFLDAQAVHQRLHASMQRWLGELFAPRRHDELTASAAGDPAHHQALLLLQLQSELDNLQYLVQMRFERHVELESSRDALTRLLNHVRASDFVFRYGGEEFLVVLVDVTDQQADAALYAAKRGGRDRVCVADDGSAAQVAAPTIAA